MAPVSSRARRLPPPRYSVTMNGHVLLAPVVHRHDVRVVERRGRLGLGPEPTEELSVLGQRVVQDLDRDAAAQASVVGQVHLGRRTHADRADQAVATAQHLADRRAHAGQGHRAEGTCRPSAIGGGSRRPPRPMWARSAGPVPWRGHVRRRQPVHARRRERRALPDLAAPHDHDRPAALRGVVPVVGHAAGRVRQRRPADDPAVVSRVPGPGDKVLRQSEVGAELKPGYDGRVLVNGVEIPEDQMVGALDPGSSEAQRFGVRPNNRNEVFFKPEAGQGHRHLAHRRQHRHDPVLAREGGRGTPPAPSPGRSR